MYGSGDRNDTRPAMCCKIKQTNKLNRQTDGQTTMRTARPLVRGLYNDYLARSDRPPKGKIHKIE